MENESVKNELATRSLKEIIHGFLKATKEDIPADQLLAWINGYRENTTIEEIQAQLDALVESGVVTRTSDD